MPGHRLFCGVARAASVGAVINKQRIETRLKYRRWIKEPSHVAACQITKASGGPDIPWKNLHRRKLENLLIEKSRNVQARL